MAIDTLIAYVGVYDSVADAEADYQLVKELHTEAGLIDGYDAAVVEHNDAGQTKIVKKHERDAASASKSSAKQHALLIKRLPSGSHNRPGRVRPLGNPPLKRARSRIRLDTGPRDK